MFQKKPQEFTCMACEEPSEELDVDLYCPHCAEEKSWFEDYEREVRSDYYASVL